MNAGDQQDPKNPEDESTDLPLEGEAGGDADGRLEGETAAGAPREDAAQDDGAAQGDGAAQDDAAAAAAGEGVVEEATGDGEGEGAADEDGSVAVEVETEGGPGDDETPTSGSSDGESAGGEGESEAEEKAIRKYSAKDFEASDAEADEKAEVPAMNWYILKVQSNRENSICDGLRRRVAVAGLDEYFGEILVPTEDVAEFKNGKRRVVKRKLYPGYIVANMVINDDTWFVVRETPGIGDFTGAAGKPTPMLPHEVDRIIKSARPDEESDEPKPAIPFKIGDRVRIKEGTFENFEGDVDVIDGANGRVTVMISIFGRSTPVELEHWQIEDV